MAVDTYLYEPSIFHSHLGRVLGRNHGFSSLLDRGCYPGKVRHRKVHLFDQSLVLARKRLGWYHS